MSLIMVFIDGLGLGEEDDINPLFRADMPFFGIFLMELR